ncbi:MAG TPA: ion channel [Chitinophagaceae bacterium]|nr:ion channel [Chitinophagaceae bacterium]
MELLRKINSQAKTEINTGFGTNSSDYGGRFVNKDGNANIEKKGIGFLERISWYHSLLAMPRWKFFSVIFLFFIAVNLVFAFIYYIIGIEHLGGVVPRSPLEDFVEAFFFSCQTFSTVGYGRISPVGYTITSIAALEGFLGPLSFALATGLLFGRFAKPTAYLKFSENAVIAPYQGGTALMFRIAPHKNTTLLDADAKVNLAMVVEENGKMVNKFFPLTLEFNSVTALTLSWTVVHPITPESPLYNFTKEDFSSNRGEVLIFIKAFDDMFSNIVVARTSYIFSEIVFGAKFRPMYKSSEDNQKTILHLDKINSFDPADISYAYNAEKATS